jgi:plasmid stabilization system protein ParE
MAHRLAPQAHAELSSIWNYIFKESGNAAVADGIIDAIAERFYLLSQHPRMGRSLPPPYPPLHAGEGRVGADCVAFLWDNT